jgi:hypothetical protein
MFDLKTAIENWKNQFSEKGALKKENIEELESHVLDEIEALKNKGLSTEESFWIANKRLGSEGALIQEFSKVNSGAIWANRLAWMFLGTTLWGMANSLLNSLYRGTLLLLHETSLSAVWMSIICSLILLSYIAGIALLARKVIRGSALNDRIASLKRWGIFTVLLIIPMLIKIPGMFSIRGLVDATSDSDFLSAYTATGFVMLAINLVISIGFIYFTARHFSKNKSQIAM